LQARRGGKPAAGSSITGSMHGSTTIEVSLPAATPGVKSGEAAPDQPAIITARR
jgi:hypothetical protein